MDHVETFRNHAAECQRMARSTSDPQSRATWDALAKRWLHCADVAEHAMADAAATADNYGRSRKLRQWSGSDAALTVEEAASDGGLVILIHGMGMGSEVSLPQVPEQDSPAQAGAG